MRRLLTHGATIRVCQIAIGAIFIAAGLAKLGDLRTFAEQIHNFRLTPVAIEHLVAIVLPWVEVVAGLALLLKVRARAGAAVAAVLSDDFATARCSPCGSPNGYPIRSGPPSTR